MVASALMKIPVRNICGIALVILLAVKEYDRFVDSDAVRRFERQVIRP